MAQSSCPKCGHNLFELKEHAPIGARFKLNFVQCIGCGAVVGTMEYTSIGAGIADLEKKIDRLLHKLNA